MLARHSARQALRDELKDDVTALLLSCGVALESGLPENTRARLSRLEEPAKHIKCKLALSENKNAAAAGA